jgi:serine protease
MNRRLLAIAIAALLVWGGCKDNTGPAKATAIAAFSGIHQSGVVAQVLPQPITVKTTDAGGNPVAGVAVAFAVKAGDGHLAATSVLTDAQGHASVTWTLGPAAGVDRDTATASVTGLAGSPVTFAAVALAGTAAQISADSGSGQQAEVGQGLGQQMVAVVTDALGNPAAGQSVVWTVTGGAGTLSAGTSPADALGHARITWTLGYTVGAGAQTLRATIPGVPGPAADFSATGALTSGQLTVSSGDQQTGGASAALPQPLVASVQAPGNHPVGGVSVDWQVTGGGGTVSAPSSVTTAQGLASISWTLGSGAGSQSAQASVTGLTPPALAFTATSVLAAAGSLTGTVTVTNGFLTAPARASGEGGAFANTVVAPGAGMSAQPRFTARDLIVTFRPAPLGAPRAGAVAMASPVTAQAVLAAIRSRLTTREAAGQLRVRDVSPAILAARVRVAQPELLDSIASLLRADPGVAAVERDRRIFAADRTRTAGDTIPNDLAYPDQSWNYTMIDLPRAWSITTGSASVLVAVVDNGIRFDHPAVAANLTNDGYDFVSMDPDSLCAGGTIDNADDGNGYDPDPTIPDDFIPDQANTCLMGHFSIGGHGLHVAGTIGAVGNDGLIVTGVNWTVSIRPVRVLGLLGGTSFDVAQGILYAAGLPASNGVGGFVQAPSAARVINVSLGGGCPSSGPDVLHDAVIAATNANALVIAAAGNNSATAPFCPAAYPEALAVSAVAADGLLASYSNYAGTAGIAAPGGDLGNDASFLILSATCNFTVNPCSPNYAYYGGTSQATPHVSGVAALLLAANPGLTSAQLRARLTDYALDAGSPGADAQYGAGIVNARNSLTQTLAPPAQLYARLYDASTGVLVATQPTGGGGSFTFNGLATGSYYVFAGEDEDSDGLIGVPGRRWGALGGTVTPTPVAVSASAGGVAFFSIGLPTETEVNNTAPAANRLVVGGYAHATLTQGTDLTDLFRVTIPQTGQYTFATTGWQGAFCRFALNVNTILTLADSTGLQLAQNNDVNAASRNFCSAISMTLTPGRYLLTVTAGVDLNSNPQSGRYRLEARAGP